MVAERHVTVRNPLGLHVRPSARIAETAARFSSTVELLKDGQAVNAKSSIDLLTLAAVEGTRLTVRATGEDEDRAVEELAQLIDGGFGE